MNTSRRRIRSIIAGVGAQASLPARKVLLVLALTLSTGAITAAAVFNVPELWRIAPPAPNISQSDRLAELRARREEVMKRMGDKAIMILFGAEPRVYTNDVDYHYRQENNLYYLTGVNQEDATLVLIPGAKRTREILFMPPRDPRNETWHGHMMSAAEARARSGIQEVWASGSLNGFLASLEPRAEQAIAKRGSVSKPNAQLAGQWQDEFQTFVEAANADQAEIYLLTPNSRGAIREYRQEYEFAEALKSTSSG